MVSVGSDDKYNPWKQPVPIFIGIDPGKCGGLVTIQGKSDFQDRFSDGGSIGIDYISMLQTESQLWEWFRRRQVMFGRSKPFAVIEKVASSPQMGVVSAFTFGKGYGSLLMCLIAAGLAFEEVRPQVWQKELNVTPRKKKEPENKWKGRLVEHARRLFPALPVWQETKKQQYAIADAILIAEYCRRVHGRVAP